MEITRGQVVTVETASGDSIEMVALSDVIAGLDFPVVRVCTTTDWANGVGDQESIPWPARNVSRGRVSA